MDARVKPAHDEVCVWYGLKKKARVMRAFPNPSNQTRWSLSGLAVDLGKVVLRGLRAIGGELAEILGAGLGPRHEQFAARAHHLGLDLHRFVERLGGSELVDAGEERLGVLVHRLLDVTA